MADGKPENNDAFSGHSSHLPIPAFDPPAKPKRNKFAMACSFLASMTSILLGYGNISLYWSDEWGYNLHPKRPTHNRRPKRGGHGDLQSLLAHRLRRRRPHSDWIGRRLTIVLAGVIFLFGALLMGLATNYAFLMVGRFVAGIGVGYALMIAPVYTAEVAPASCRGLLLSFPELFINIGAVVGFAADLAFSHLPTNLGWRFMLGVGMIPSLILTLVTLVMPESPRWLVMQGRLAEAKHVLERTSDSLEEAKSRLSDIKQAAGIPEHCNDDVVSIPKGHHGKGVWRELFLHPPPVVLHIMLCAFGMHFFQMTSGIEPIILYSPEIFEKAGIKNDTHKLLGTMAIGFVKTLSILVAMFLSDKIGRRPLLLTSVAGCCVCLMGLGTGLTFIQNSDHRLIWALALCVGSILCYVSIFSLGLGPITWVYSTEIFPLRLRAQGCGLAIAVNRVTSAVCTMTFISLYKAITIGGAFFLYAGFAALAWVFYYTLFPETRGKTLEEIEALFGTFFKWRSTMRALNEKKGDVSGQVQTGND
ncbi:UNVERIFIED_CONTAM: Polyol transporter 5 [Sesamum radiatum]|uniref:Polyol transporter 5 n=1 Tax=Sesamum radiatum TaxID=300843 RepID=A0AAW2MSU3_SESRA